MANSTPKQQLDLEDLALHEGATVLLRRTLAQLRAGDWFEVRGDSRELVEQLGKLGRISANFEPIARAQLPERMAQEDRGAFVQRQVFQIKLLFGCGIGHGGFGYIAAASANSSLTGCGSG
jgi:hypothetical protein